MKMVLKPPFVIPKKSYSHFSSFLHHASDRSANFLTVLAGRTVKISPSPIGRGFEPGRRQDFSDRSIRPHFWNFKREKSKWLNYSIQ